MSKLVNPHGGGELKPLLLEGAALELERAKSLPKVRMSSRETGDVIMMGIGGFTPLAGFMTKADWASVCDGMRDGHSLYWPIPITLSTDKVTAPSTKEGAGALTDGETGEIMATMKVTEKYAIDKAHECMMVYKTTDLAHPGVKMVMDQGEIRSRRSDEVAVDRQLQERIRRPVHDAGRNPRQVQSWAGPRSPPSRHATPCTRSHEYLAKIAIETMVGVLIHSCSAR